MENLKFYHYEGVQYLELHDNRTLNYINKPFSYNDYADAICAARLHMNEHFGLNVYYLGRSGRHVCVDDTPANRDRYNSLVEHAIKWEREIIDYFNNEYEYEIED